ncbi:MAG: TRAP transporter substrate-binding protein [Hyphomicrobiaceae bacterium]
MTSRVSKPIEIRMAGYGPETTCFSKALKGIGEKLQAQFGSDIEVKYIWNIMDFGYKAEDICWLVECGFLTLGYQSTSYFTSRIPDLAILDLPFIFADNDMARRAMDGELGQIYKAEFETKMNYRILGYFENGFRHVSNCVRPVHTPSDLNGLRLRVLPSKIQARTFELLGADPKIMDLSEARAGIADGTLDAQENPFANTVTYGVHNYHKHHTMTGHSYLSRPIFVHQQSYDGYPKELQAALSRAARDAIDVQRELGMEEDREAGEAIKAAGGKIVDLSQDEQQAFRDAVQPLLDEAVSEYDNRILNMVSNL